MFKEKTQVFILTHLDCKVYLKNLAEKKISDWKNIWKKVYPKKKNLKKKNWKKISEKKCIWKKENILIYDPKCDAEIQAVWFLWARVSKQ